MTRNFRRFALLGCALLAVAFSSPARGELKAGAANADISPKNLPVIVNGGFLEARAEKVHDRLSARAIALDDGNTKILLVVVDSCMMPRELIDKAKDLIQARAGVPTDRIMISATHTHTAPSVMGALGSSADAAYAAELPALIADAASNALKNAEPAKVGWNSVDDYDHTHCRRWIRRPDKMLVDPFGNLSVRANMHPGHLNPDVIGPSGPVDPGLGVLAIQALDGRPIALFANYSMHYYGAPAVSADYYGAFAEQVERVLGKNENGKPAFVAMMSQGTSGDQQWMDYGAPPHRTNHIDYAKEVAKVALGAYAGITSYRANATLAMAETELKLKRRVPDEKRLAWAKPIVQAMAGRIPKTQVEVYAREAAIIHDEPERVLKLQAVRIGDLGITAIPNEVYAITGLKLKGRSPLSPTFNVELANGSEGYIPPPEQHLLGGYTTWPARTAGLETEAEPRIVESLLRLLEQVSRRTRKDMPIDMGAYGEAVLKAKPVAYWRMNEIDGRSAADSSGKGAAGIYEGGVAYYLDGPRSPAFSGNTVRNRAPHFAGGRLKASASGIGSTYTISLWFWNGLPDSVRDVTGHVFGVGSKGDYLAIDGAKGVAGRLRFGSSANPEASIIGGPRIEPKTWNHVAVVREGTKVSIYLNGSLEPDFSGEAPIASAAPDALYIGDRGDGSAGFEGRIDEVAAYARALSGAEIAEQFKTAGTRIVTLPDTSPLTWEDDVASRLVDGVDRFLLRELDRSAARRAKFWKRDASSAVNYEASIKPNRDRLSHILGVRDPRPAFDSVELVGTISRPAKIGQGSGFDVFSVRWPSFGDVHAEGLLLVPTGRAKIADVVAVPDADVTPEQLAGLAPGVPPESQYARRLAESGCRVIVPCLIDRGVTHRKLSNREFLYRSAFELGRHIIGYEIQHILAAVDWFSRDAGSDANAAIGVIGWGEGGMLALLASAIDPRIDSTCVSGYFEDRRDVWKEPIYRNVFGLLEQFGDAELAAMIAPRTLVIEAAKGPELTVPPGTGGGPGRLATPDLAVVSREVEKARKMVAGLSPAATIVLAADADGRGAPGSRKALDSFLQGFAGNSRLAEPGAAPKRLNAGIDVAERHRRLFNAIDRHNQRLLIESPYVRQEYMKKLDTSSIEAYQKTVEPYRAEFRDEIIGRFEEEKFLPPNVRSRRILDEPKYEGYEVVMDVFPDVFAFGILLLPKDLKAGEKRPVVVCQHGLEGRPRDVADPRVNNPAYNMYAVKLAERGFITFAPQNLYIFTDRFRTLQRKGNPLKKTLFSVIVPQHQQITDWLKSLLYVDPSRIAFYGLSYGGKSAMRIPPLVSNYRLSICSADFNEWVWKNASSRSPYSYVWTGEYEIFEFDLGSTFNYAEMAALIAPRPFMVERGHFDGVAPDETVAHEFAKVRFLYEAKLKLVDQCELEWFVGPHTINGVGTFNFLHKHLNWPKP